MNAKIVFLQVRGNVYPYTPTHTPVGVNMFFLPVRENMYSTTALSYHLKGLNSISQVLLENLQHCHHLTGLNITHGCKNILIFTSER